MEKALEALLSVAQRNIPANASDDTVEKLTASALDKSAIVDAQTDLANAMYQYCLNLGITQATVNKAYLPTGFYELLPAAYSSSSAPTLTPVAPVPQDSGGGETD